MNQAMVEMRSCVLENGLQIFYFPKPNFSKTFAMLATNYGSIDASFTLDGNQFETPAGVAHFLEHKMFEEKDGNALQKFGKTGASPNAFTSHTMTAYHFTCTSDFEANLEILLRFVYTPYFTSENVEKEKGIIAQEIGMMRDTPSWMTYVGLFEGLYHNHPIHTSIAGSVESITEITPEILLRCHEAFYSPSNMILTVCGQADFDKIVEMAKQLTPKQSKKIAARHYGVRQKSVAASEVVRHMEVSRPNFLMGFKDIPLAEGESRLQRACIGDLALRILCSSTSELYAKLYAEGLITRGFDSEYMIFPEGAVAILGGGESRDPRQVRTYILEALQNFAQNGIATDLLERRKKAVYGLKVRSLDKPDEICWAQTVTAFSGENFLDFDEYYQRITVQDVQEMFVRWASPDSNTLSIILPNGQGDV